MLNKKQTVYQITNFEADNNVVQTNSRAPDYCSWICLVIFGLIMTFSNENPKKCSCK